MTTATGPEWQLAAAAGGALCEVAALAASLQEGRWQDGPPHGRRLVRGALPRRRAAEYTTRDAGEPGVRLRCYLDLRQLRFLAILNLEPTHAAGQRPERVPVARHGSSCEC
ncbi:DUF6207 family protein [Streptomyces sp. A0592]|uniref:DUF6207 family protein n=1 Tax=Streptomyces sp. A0592 TaxID=2563099 RepID=UPI001F11930A|nr:DUF6207 family protein [Streptomyces sp. A0592]